MNTKRQKLKMATLTRCVANGYCRRGSTILTTGGGRLCLSGSALLLHCGSGLYSDFLRRVLCGDTALFRCNKQLDLTHYSFGL